MLTDTMFWRLVWKEYRVQRKLWLAVLVLTPVVQLCLLLPAPFTGVPVGGLFVGIALAATAVYMLGCGATLFATERELETFEFQRSLPVDAWRVFAAKTGWALASGGALAVVLWSATFVLFVRQWLPDLERYVLIGLVATAEVFAWGVCFSLLLRRPLWAAFLGVLVPSAIIGNLLPGTTAINWTWGAFEYHRHYLAPRAVLAGVVFLADVWLARLWFAGRLENLCWPARGRDAAGQSYPDAAADQPLPAFEGGRRAGWARLFWLVGRRTWWIVTCLAFFYAAVFCLAQLEDGDRGNVHPPDLTYPTLLAALVFGLCAFGLDQARGQFRWYAERGISPRRVWLAEQLVWLPLVVLAGAGVSLFGSDPNASPRPDFEWAVWMSICFWIPLTWYALAQFCAMFLRSTLVAAVGAVALAVLATTWNVLMVAGDVPLAWSVVPIPLVLLLVTWLHAPDWVEERWNRRVALRLALVLGLPTLLLAIAVPLRRAYQIPLVDPEFSVAEFTRPLTAREEQTLDLYLQAWQLQRKGLEQAQQAEGRERGQHAREHPGWPKGYPAAEASAEWRQIERRKRRRELEAQQPALAVLRQAHRREAVPLTLLERRLASVGVSGVPSVVRGFVTLFQWQAQSLQDSGDLDGAWQHYDMALEVLRRFRLRASARDIREADWGEADVLVQIANWAANPQQTRQRTALALTALAEAERRGLTGDSAAKRYHVAMLSALHGDASELPDNDPWLPDLRNWGPRCAWWPVWERQRIERLLNHATQASLAGQARRAAKVQVGSVDRWDELPWLSPEVVRFSESTWFPDACQYVAAGYMTDSLLERTVNCRGTQILIALADWRREHGALPDSLESLVGPHFNRLPVDPITGQAFLYFPQGIPEEIGPPRFAGFVADESELPVLLPAGRPFLWSAGASRTVTLRRTGADQWEFRNTFDEVVTQSEGLALGRLMPVPLPGEE